LHALVRGGEHASPAYEYAGSGYYPITPTCQIPRLDDVYELFLGKKNDGTFVEVGAFDGEYVSNTSCLADMGWKGHYIEPVTDHFHRCVQRHAKNTNTKVYNIGIGAEDGGVTEIASLGAISTVRADSLANYQNIEWTRAELPDQIRKQRIQLVSLDSFLKEKGIQPGFELLVVDVEGYESAVLGTFPLEQWKIKMIIVEMVDSRSDYSFLHHEQRQLHRTFLRSGYIPVFKDFTNTVYVWHEIY
jgi:FkbM family methyltransferase